ncbi:unnamed protein product [Orchesella dallaii]|uniref:F-box domain-containing protein n=1 Tax=Orchesella dallaii TaxID=48710 RepID=A0ABP1R3F3_9HEXA
MRLAVVEHLLKLVDEKDLANCRLVCSLWCKGSLTRWRRTQTVIVRDVESGLSKHASFSEFLDFMDCPANQCAEKPFTKFKLTNWLNKKSVYYQKWRHFWERCAPKMETLKLETCVISSQAEFEDFFYSLSLPNLKELHFNENICQRRLQMSHDDRLNPANFYLNSGTVQGALNKVSIPIYKFGGGESGPPVHWIEFFTHFPNVTVSTFCSY